MSDLLDGKIRIALSDGKLAATIFLAPGLEAGMLSLELFIGQLGERSVSRAAIDEAAITKMIEDYDPENGSNADVASGKPPVHGKDGYLELDTEIAEKLEEGRKRIETADEMAEQPPPEVDPEDPEAVNFYEQSAFCMVEAGTRLGVVHPPTEGEDGVDVTGMALSPRTGKSFNLKADESIEVKENGEVVATTNGFVEHDHEVLRVLKTLTIEGYVDFSTGNIIGFEGDVEVRKGVRDNFKIDVGGSILIAELVEAAHLTSGGDITLARGMAGREKGTIDAGRDFSARYIDAVTGKVGRDATIQREITNVDLEVGRKLSAPTAAVIGGELRVVRTCEVAQLGSEAGAHTTVVLGKLPEQERLAKEAHEVIPLMRTRLEKSQKKLEQLEGATTKLTAQQAEELTELQFEVACGQQKIEPLRQRMANLILAIDALATDPTLIVQRVIHAGAELLIGSLRCKFENDVKGPVKIDLDERGEPQVQQIGSDIVAPLSRFAKVLPEDRFVDLAKIREDCADLLAKAQEEAELKAIAEGAADGAGTGDPEEAPGTENAAA